jgi:hypothetical protein
MALQMDGSKGTGIAEEVEAGKKKTKRTILARKEPAKRATKRRGLWSRITGRDPNPPS